jgi:DNA-binding XRE family transcriptional regulator
MVETKIRTAFSQWRDACGLDIEEAAEALCLTKQMIVYLEQGHASDGRPLTPQPQTRKLMTAIFKGFDLVQWPI